ncbi:hypothetical protein DFH29DRAFT_801165, partial [Suillus ampliporus]
SHISKYDMGQLDFQLHDSLEEWRESTTRRIYGDSILNDYGPGMTMPDSVLDCIVDCAHHKKNSTTNNLHKETKWSAINRFGSDIIAIIHRIIPVPMLTPVLTMRHLKTNLPSIIAPQNNGTQSSHSVTVVARKQLRCGACGIEGHTSKLFPHAGNNAHFQ